MYKIAIFGMFAFFISCIAAMITHIWVCVAANKAALLLLGFFFFPAGIIHGFGVWFGIW